MLRSYLKIAFRNLAKNRLYSFVNIAGLTTGITCCILIGMYIIHELSYDRFHQHASRIVRVTTEYSISGTVVKTPGTPTKAGPLFTRVFPQVESFVRLSESSDPIVVRYKDRLFNEKKFLFTDSTFFKIFSFKLIEGNAGEVLNGDHKIVITEAMKRKYFGNEEAIGKTLTVFNQNFQVTGVAENPPTNSQIKFDFLIYNNPREEWIHLSNFTYLLLRNETEITDLEEKLIRYMKAQTDVPNISRNNYFIFHLEPLTRVHLYASQEGLSATLESLDPLGNIVYIYVLSLVAILILCIACVNYTNLAIAQSSRRSAEIGIRKVMGARHWQLFSQFIGESMVMTTIALVFSVIAAIMILPAFNIIAGKELTAGMLLNPRSLIVLLLFGFFISITAGAYPAIVLSGFKLVKILKSGFSFSKSGGNFRKSLIVFQFMISVFLIVSTIVISQQIAYMQKKDLGFDKDQVLVLPAVYQNFEDLKAAIERSPNVKKMSAAYEAPTVIHWDDNLTTGSGQGLAIRALPVDRDIVQTLGLHIIAGADFTLADFKSMDTNTVKGEDQHSYFMLNEAAVKALGWKPTDAIGKIIHRSNEPGTIKAVVKDFHIASLHEPISPLLIFLDPKNMFMQAMFVKISGNNIPKTLASLKSIWSERVPDRSFEYHFLDEDYNTLYISEQQTGRIFSIFSSLAIILACLGLFALTAYSVVQRTREIGIRKVLGASVQNIVGLVSKDFIQLVLLAVLLASPIAWFAMHTWLEDFAYRINISGWVFVTAGITAIIIALAILSFHAVKAAIANPITSLRSE